MVYPVDTVSVRRTAGEETVYSNAESPEERKCRTWNRSASGWNPALVVWHNYGTGNIHGWKLIDVRGGRARSWKQPDLVPALSAKLGAGETFGKQEGPGVRAVEGGLVEGHLVYRAGEPNCCPSGGVMRVQLGGKDGALFVVRVWREPMP
jgi:hypothetical protein